MKIFKCVILLLFCVTILSSCVTQKRCNDKFPPIISMSDSNSSSQIIIYKDTVVHDTIPGDTIFVEVLLECDKNGKLINKPKTIVHSDIFIDVYFSIKNNKPLIEVIRKPIYRDYLFQKIYNEKITSHFTKNSTVATVVEYKIPVWVWLLIGALSTIIFILLIRRRF